MSVFTTIYRLLSFRLVREEMLALDRRHFIAGLIGTWVVGMGRYWDDPGAKVLQHLGLGSVIYIFVMAFLIWLTVLPFKVEKWSYFRVLTFVSLTSFPAILYAIPIELWVDIKLANTINVWFLAVVALWRLSLLFFFLSRFTPLKIIDIIASALLPICLIIATLTYLNLHRVVFNIMGGRRNPTPHDGAYGVLTFLTLFSIIALLPLLFTYLRGIHLRRKELAQEKDRD